MRPTLDITCGTDVVLNVRLIFRGETFDPSLSSEVEAYLVSGLGRRTAVDVDIIDDEAVVTIPWITGRLPGRYGLEVRGMINGLHWSTVADGLIRYTRGTMPGTTEPITVESDAYDISMEVSYRYGETPLEEVTATVDDGVGEPSVDYIYVSRKLRLDFHNLKGDEGVGIDHVEPTDVHTGDGETSTYTMKRTDGSDGGTIEVVNGRKGSQGDSAVFNPDDPETPSFKMANTLGGSTTKSMTQKSVTDAICKYVISEWEEFSNPSYVKGYIAKDSDTMTVGSGTDGNRLYYIPVTAGQVLRITVEGSTVSTNPNVIGFTEDIPADGDHIDVFDRIEGADFQRIVSSYGNGYITFYVRSNSLDFSLTVEQGETTEELMEQVSDLIEENNDKMDALEAKVEQETTADVYSIPFPADNDYSASGPYGGNYPGRSRAITNSDTWSQSSSGSLGFYIDITKYAGEKLKITPREGQAFNYTFLKEKPATSGSVGYCAGESYHKNVAEQITVNIPAAENGGNVYFYCLAFSSASEGVRSPLCPQSALVEESISDFLSSLSNLADGTTTYHVDEVNGSDENDGLTAATAFKTLSKAVAMSDKNVSLVLHGDIHEGITMSGKGRVRIISPMVAAKTAPDSEDANNKYMPKARIICGTHITEAEEVSGYSGVLVSAQPKSLFIDSSSNVKGFWLFQHDVPDAATRIPTNELHPLQHKRTYRLTSSRLEMVGSIQEVSQSEGLSYYYDDDEEKLYFKIADETALADNPVVIREVSNAFDIECEDFEMLGVEVLYSPVVVKAQGARFTECGAMYGANGFRCGDNDYRGFSYIRCEAAGCMAELGGNGDGFGSRSGSTMLVDCWAHDCYDDGYSEHNGAETTIIGGLFEYNGKGGIVPSHNCHATIIHALCRRNTGKGVMPGAGIFHTGDQGNGYVEAYGCVCADNCVNYMVDNAKNRMVLTNCISLRANTDTKGREGGEPVPCGFGFYAKKNAYIMLHNCYDLGSVKVKETANGGQIVVENANLVV